jgi:RNA-directed DNA polymerase
MNPLSTTRPVEKLNIMSVNRLAELLKIPKEKLVELAEFSRSHYSPFEMQSCPRPFQRIFIKKKRQIDNPQGDLKRVQRRINNLLLQPICFPENLLGGIPKRSVTDNAHHHLKASLLVTLDVKSCFPSITNPHVYRVWQIFLGCSTPVSKLLTKLTTFNRYLPQGAPTSPLLANLVIWMFDEPIRRACEERSVNYSTWIDDLAFSGDRARELIQIAVLVLAKGGLKVSRSKIRIMGPRDVKLLTGTRLGGRSVRVPKEKLSRIRSGIHKLEAGLIQRKDQIKFIDGIVGQLRYVKHLNPKDASALIENLALTVNGTQTSASATKFLGSKRQ